MFILVPSIRIVRRASGYRHLNRTAVATGYVRRTFMAYFIYRHVVSTAIILFKAALPFICDILQVLA